MPNPYAAELSRQVSQRYTIDADNMPGSVWLCKNTKLKGEAFSFDKYPFQRALVDDTVRVSVCVKPTQVGVSEIYQRVALMMLARARFRKGIYAYPDDDMRKKNCQSRVLPMAKETKAFAPAVDQSWTRSIHLIELDRSFLYMTGSKEGDATSTDADFVFLDEYDRHDMSIAALFSSRLQNSNWRIERYFSTPTFTEFGVDRLFRDSDQCFYLIKCDSCNHWQFPLFEPRFIQMPGLPPDWESLLELNQDVLDRYSINLHDSYACCEKCRSRLDLGREDNRAWVPKYPSRQTMRGRKINPFSASTRPVIDLVTSLFHYKSLDFIRGFKNATLGEPEDSSSSRIEVSVIKNALKSSAIPTIDKEMPTWIGCDMGHTCHLVVGQGETPKKIRTVLMEQVPLGRIKERIMEVKNTYNLVGGMVDRHPESQVAADIWEMTEGLVVPGEYRGDAEMTLKMVPDDDKKVQYVQINRTLHLDQVPRALRRGELEIEGYGLLHQEIIDQLRNMVRVEEPEKPAVWNKLTPNDHFFHSFGFMYSAMKLRPYTELKVGPVLTTLGFATADMKGYDGGLLSRASQWQQVSNLF